MALSKLEISYWTNTYKDQQGALYSEDGKTLLTVPTDLISYNVAEGTENINHRCFRNCTSLKEVSLPASLKRIGKSAFNNCLALETIIIPDNVYSIGESAFAHCFHLHTAFLPSAMIEIPKRMFFNCKSLHEITFPEKIFCVLQEAFYGCLSLQHVSLNEGLEMIFEKAFKHCESLQEFIMPDSVRFMEEETLANCTSLKSIVLSDAIEDFGFSCCPHCPNIESVDMRPSEEFIKQTHSNWDFFPKRNPKNSINPYPNNYFWKDGDNLYCGIDGLSSVTLVCSFIKGTEYTVPAFVNKVRAGAFINAPQLRTLILPEGSISIDDTLHFWTQLDTIKFYNRQTSKICLII